MSDSPSQSKEKPEIINVTSKNNTTIIHHPGAVHFGAGNINSNKGITTSLFWLLTLLEHAKILRYLF